jgi:hypothetical protein
MRDARDATGICRRCREHKVVVDKTAAEVCLAMTRRDLYELVDRIPDSLLEDGTQLVGPDDLWTLSNVLVEFANWSADLWGAWIEHSARRQYPTIDA